MKHRDYAGLFLFGVYGAVMVASGIALAVFVGRDGVTSIFEAALWVAGLVVSCGGAAMLGVFLFLLFFDRGA